MKEYTLGFVVDKNAENVLLLQRARDPYAGLFNGIGGKVQDNEMPMICMLREMEEETGLTLMDVNKVSFVMRIELDTNEILHTYCIELENTIPIHHRTDEGDLYWFNIDKDGLLNPCNPMMAGDGRLPYILNTIRRKVSDKSNCKLPIA